jgi:hypothetical protein
MKDHNQDTSKLPDLCIEWNRKNDIRSIELPNGKIIYPGLDRRTGDHRPIGMFISSLPYPGCDDNLAIDIELIPSLVIDAVHKANQPARSYSISGE